MKKKILTVALLICVPTQVFAAAGLIMQAPEAVPIAECEAYYEKVVNEEHANIIDCAATYGTELDRFTVCQQLSIEHTNKLLFDNKSCRYYYMSYGVLPDPKIKQLVHKDLEPHPEHFPHRR